MREIKFRCFFYDGENISTGKIINAIEAYNDNLIEFCDSGELRPIDQCAILMQYTGLKDKNGKEIYEDDVLSCFVNGKKLGATEVVEFKNGQFILRHRNVSIHQWLTETTNYLGEVEVIGNVFENPELLNKTTNETI